MDYSQLKKELLVSLRGRVAQTQLSHRLGLTFNKAYRWESGAVQMMWPDLVDFCKALKVPLDEALKESFSYSEDLKKTSRLLKLFMGQSSQKEVADLLKVSRYTLSRWLKGTSQPRVEQVFHLMDYAAPEFLKFVQLLTRYEPLPALAERVRLQEKQSKIYGNYPWISILLSALTLDEYEKNPTHDLLARKTRLPLADVKLAMQDLADSGLIEWNGKFWKANYNRFYLQTSADEKIMMAKYVFNTALRAADNAKGNPHMRLSWKMFSTHHSQYEKILQRYTEFFNDIGKLIDQDQESLDKVYLLATAVIDYDHLK